LFLLGVELVFPLVLIVAVLFLVARARSGQPAFAGGLAIVGFSVIAIGVLFVWLFQVIHYPGYQWWQGIPGGPPSNQTVVPPTGKPIPTGNGSGVPPGSGNSGSASFWAALVAWLPVLGGVAVAGTVALLVLPRLSPAEEEATDDRTARAGLRALTEAITELDKDGAEPRRVIRAAYARLLLRAQERLPPLAPATPGEIERMLVERLHVSPQVAEELTGLFEEARYSTHPLGPGDVARARTLLGQALEGIGPAAEAPAA
jgi:hypothetical protein